MSCWWMWWTLSRIWWIQWLWRQNGERRDGGVKEGWGIDEPRGRDQGGEMKRRSGCRVNSATERVDKGRMDQRSDGGCQRKWCNRWKKRGEKEEEGADRDGVDREVNECRWRRQKHFVLLFIYFYFFKHNETNAATAEKPAKKKTKKTTTREQTRRLAKEKISPFCTEKER